jgi:hypothetical protein
LGIEVPGIAAEAMRGMQRDASLMRWSRRASLAAMLASALLASGCSGSSLLGTSPASGTDPTSSPSFKEKIAGFFSSRTATSPQAVTNAPQEIECPLINIRQGASTLIIGPSGSRATTSTDNGAMAVRYQGTFVRAARECTLVGGNVVMRVGVEGRIITGPAGGPGQVDVPLRIAVVDEAPAHMKPITTKFVRIPVTIASATDNPTFTHIEDDVTFPLPTNIDTYVVYIGFDPLALQPEKPEPKPKPKAKQKPG